MNYTEQLEELQQRVPAEGRSLDGRPGAIEADDMKDVLANVDAEDRCVARLVPNAHEDLPSYRTLPQNNEAGRRGGPSH